RRRNACGLSARLRHPHSGALFSDPGHAAGAGVSRRRLRVSISRCRAQDLLGSWLLLRLADRNHGPGNDARRLHPGIQGRGPRLCRRGARFLDAVLGSDRHCARLRLRAPRCWLAGDDIQARARRYGRICLAVVVIGIVVVSLWTPLASDAVFSRWFSWPNILILSPVPIASALVAWATWRALSGASQFGGFFGAVGLFALSYFGMTISLFPMIVPHHFTLMQAASPPG